MKHAPGTSVALAAASACLALAIGMAAASPALAQNSGASIDMQRLYNPNSGEHFYTADTSEASGLVSLGWRHEGSGWVAPQKSSTPVYRLYNPNAGDHHYTTSVEERDVLVEKGWNYEGVGWYSSDNKSVAVLRQYNPNAKAGAHNFTTSSAENDNLVNAGWKAEGVAWYAVAEGKPAVDGAIMGVSTTTPAGMAAYYRAMGKKNGFSYPSEVESKGGAATIETFAQIVYEEANAEGIRAEVVFCQAMHETGWLQYGGDVSPDQFNYAGLGATGNGEPGNRFCDVRTGVRAQVQHLKAYASNAPLINECVDKRFKYVKTRGVAPTVNDLTGKWAVPGVKDGVTYGGQIASLMNELANYKA
ncbi:hypothetical protein HMPREF1008_01419 [Olsenella sp. oral taxon 809 str. F0356]|uniref:glucosaminidase domain-containing protein n=1 Tax=Olsenella sp. oral taxon 809 TaxID=661086 RepID=UPI000231F1D5|nr:glucosaminidase domain-containing protein [Olsenella sp. oral taxon 809]EHF01795.1 hypothetical protein HMPREF1008_01419 [Olsenella sp. oral taxon 809 str. F0356]